MHDTLPEATLETRGNRALNGPETPSWPAAEGAQITLGSPDEKCLLAASRMAAMVKDAQRASDFTLGTVGRFVGKETPYVSKCLDVQDPHSVLRMVAAIVILDTQRVWLRGFAAMAGCELVERPKMTAEQKVAALEAYLRRRGKVGEMEIEEAYSEAQP